LELDVDLGAAASITVSPFSLVPKLTLPPLRESPIEDDFDGGVGRKTLAKVLVKLSVRACDDEDGPPHCSLMGGLGSTHGARWVIQGCWSDAHRVPGRKMQK
jgi:hypothetical protein